MKKATSIFKVCMSMNSKYSLFLYKDYRSKYGLYLSILDMNTLQCRVYVYIYKEFILFIIYYVIYNIYVFFQDHSVSPSLSHVSERHNLHTCCSFQATPPGPNQQNPATAVVRDGRTAKWKVVKNVPSWLFMGA